MSKSAPTQILGRISNANQPYRKRNMDYSKFSKAFRTLAEGFTLLAESLEESNEVPEVFEEPAAWQEEEEKAKEAKNPAPKKPVSKKVWDEEPPAEKDPEVIELEDLQEVGRQVIKLLGAPALAKVLKTKGLKNLSSADPKDYPTLYAALKEMAND